MNLLLRGILNYMKIIDLSHSLADNMPVYPGDVPPRLRQVASVEKDGLNKYELISATHAGTHIDAPLHFLSNGKKISEFPPEKFMGRAVVVYASGKTSIDASLLEGKNINAGDIVIVATGWYKKFGQEEYFKNFPLLEKSFAQKLVDLKVSMLGLDTCSPDELPFEIHKILLAKEILIIENLTNTENLLGVNELEIIALPLNIEADASPARVIARIP